MSSLSIQCPRCNNAHKVGTDRIDEQMYCRICGSAFHLSSRGLYVLGLKGKEKVTSALTSSVELTAADFQGADRVDRIPRVAYWMAGGVLGVTVFAGLLWSVFAGPSALPEGLEDRSRVVAEGFIRNDVDWLASRPVSGDLSSVRNWLRKSRPSDWPSSVDPSMEIETEVLIRDERAGIAYVLVTIRASDSGESGSGAATWKGAMLELPLFWRLDGRGEWRLDAARCWREGPRSS